MNYEHIFWDWNGTLLDDVDYCISTVNISLKARNMPLVTKEKYWQLFRFPIVDYYVDLGFSFADGKDDYHVLAEEYNLNYAANNSLLNLRKDTREVLAVMRSKGIKQYILSASERSVLTDALKGYGIEGYFDKILCTDNYLAEGKASYGKAFADTLPKGSKILLVGDTPHDEEVAKIIGADCVLMTGGHMSREKLSELHSPIIDGLHELYPIIFGGAKNGKKPTFMNADSAETRSFDIAEAEPKNFKTRYKDFYDDLKNTNKTEDW